MVRKLASAVSLALLLGSGGARALGLGDIDLHSALNQPLSAEIVLIGVRGDELDNLKVALASNAAFARAGLERSSALSGLRFEVASKGNRHVIRLTSSQPIREPFLDFLLEVSWTGGQMTREYTVLLDPPVLMPAPAPMVRAPVAAPKVAVPAAKPQPQAAPRPAVPAPVTPPAARAAEVEARVTPGQFGPTQRNDTLWSIASQVRPDSSVSINQVMQSLLRANPEAFINNNINNLKTGYILRVPSKEEILAISRDEAKRAVQEQNQRWKEGRMPTAAETPQAAPAQAAEARPEAEATAAPQEEAAPPARPDEAKLKLVAPSDEEVAAAKAGAEGAAAPAGEAAGTEGDTLRTELNLTAEAVEAQRQETEELRARLSDLETQITTMQRLITLKDEQLAGMQAAGGGAASPAVPADEAAPAEPTTADTSTTEASAPTVVASAQPEESATVSPPAVPAATADADRPDRETAEPGLLNQPATLGMLGSIALVIAALVWFFMRRRQMTAPAFKEQVTGRVAERAPGGPVAAAAPAAVAASEQTVVRRPPVEEPMPEEEMPVEAGGAPAAQSSDPISEADFYLAYGRYQQAEDLIKSALDRAPSDALRLKLVEIYHATRNTDAFNDEAQRLQEAVGANDPVWEQVAGLGRDLDPANPLYAETEDATRIKSFAPAEESVPEAQVPDFFDYEPAAGEESPMVDTGLDNSIDFTPAEPFAETPVMEEGLEDEVVTKLELAQAYIDMGDAEGARSILDEVLQEGNTDQKRQAEDLLQRIS